MRNRILVFISFMSFQILYSQIEFSEKENILMKDEFIYTLNENQLSIINLDTEDIAKTDIYFEDLDNYYVNIFNKELYLFENNGGKVYKLIDSKFKRIDNSYSHNLHYGSLNFNYKNQHYRFGGYGFFERRSSLIHYDFELNEWVLDYNFDEYFIKGLSHVSFHYLKDDVLTIFGFFKGDKGGKDSKYSPEVIEIDLSQNTTFKIGEINESFFPKSFKNYFSYNDILILLKTQFEIYLINKENGNYSNFETKKSIEKLLGVYNEKLFFLRNKNTYDETLILDYFDFDDLNKVLKEKNLFKNKNQKPLLIIFIILIILILYFTDVKVINKNENIVEIVNEGILLSNNELVNLKNEYLILILYLFENKGSINNNQILEFLGNAQLDHGHQNRIKIELIKSINDIVYSRTKEKLILTKKDVTDKRSNKYLLNPKFVYVNKYSPLT